MFTPATFPKASESERSNQLQLTWSQPPLLVAFSSSRQKDQATTDKVWQSCYIRNCPNTSEGTLHKKTHYRRWHLSGNTKLKVCTSVTSTLSTMTGPICHMTKTDFTRITNLQDIFWFQCLTSRYFFQTSTNWTSKRLPYKHKLLTTDKWFLLWKLNIQHFFSL